MFHMGHEETTLSAHMKAAALRTFLCRHPAAKALQGPILAANSKFHTVTFETSSHGGGRTGLVGGGQVGSLSR